VLFSLESAGVRRVALTSSWIGGWLRRREWWRVDGVTGDGGEGS